MEPLPETLDNGCLPLDVYYHVFQIIEYPPVGHFINLKTEPQKGLSNLPKVSHPVSDWNPVPDCPVISILEGFD